MRPLPTATVAASTFALVMPLALPTVAGARASGRPGAATHRIVPHAAKSNSHNSHPFRSDRVELTAFSTRIEFSVRPLHAASAFHPPERRTPTASARGPPKTDTP